MKPDYSHAISLAFWLALVSGIILILSSCEVPKTQVEKPLDIASIVESSDCSKEVFAQRGKAPKAFLVGMAKFHALKVCGKDKPVYLDEGTSKNDIVSYYGIERSMRGIHTFLIGLGMRESSGKHCEGRDKSASNVKSDSAEAGMFQTSYDARYSTPSITGLHSSYKGACLLEEFSQGIVCDVSEAVTWGDGVEGRAFQKMSKECPAFAVEVVARVIRKSGGSSSHYGPIRRKEVEVKASCSKMLEAVEAQLNSQTCAQLLK